jgi:hypothetical protein
MSKSQTEVKLPLLLPLYKSPGSRKPVLNANRLIFIGVICVYYSFQHPVAFAVDKRFVINKPFWVRRRMDRAMHTNAIWADVQALLKTTPVIEMPDNFLAELYDVMVDMNSPFIPSAPPKAPTKKVAKFKRRVVL